MYLLNQCALVPLSRSDAPLQASTGRRRSLFSPSVSLPFSVSLGLYLTRPHIHKDIYTRSFSYLFSCLLIEESYCNKQTNDATPISPIRLPDESPIHLSGVSIKLLSHTNQILPTQNKAVPHKAVANIRAMRARTCRPRPCSYSRRRSATRSAISASVAIPRRALFSG